MFMIYDILLSASGFPLLTWNLQEAINGSVHRMRQLGDIYQFTGLCLFFFWVDIVFITSVTFSRLSDSYTLIYPLKMKASELKAWLAKMAFYITSYNSIIIFYTDVICREIMFVNGILAIQYKWKCCMLKAKLWLIRRLKMIWWFCWGENTY